MQPKNQRLLPHRAASWNVLSGNVSNPNMMRIPLVTNTVRMPPSGLVPGEIPRSRKAIPLEYDLLEFLVGVIAAPVVLPALMLRSVAEAVEEQARYETDVESMLRDELLENEMRYESSEISEEAYRRRKGDLTRRLEELEK